MRRLPRFSLFGIGKGVDINGPAGAIDIRFGRMSEDSGTEGRTGASMGVAGTDAAFCSTCGGGFWKIVVTLVGFRLLNLRGGLISGCSDGRFTADVDWDKGEGTTDLCRACATEKLAQRVRFGS